VRLALLLLSLILSVAVMAKPQPGPPAAAAPAAKDPNQIDTKDIKTVTEALAAEAAGNSSDLMKLLQPFNYDKNEHPRDPFRLPEASLEPMQPGPIFGPFLEMHEIPIDQIKVQGIILDPSGSKAIISYHMPGSDKDKTATVRVGDALGENFGRVQSISDGKIVILQTLDENGAFRTTTHVLSIRKYNK